MVVKRSMKKRCIGVILILLLLLFEYSAIGETVSMNASGVPNLALSVDPTERTEGFSAILYNNPNGLPTSEANAIAETGEGFIWIGSYAGLIRYDGNTFERFDSTTGIANVRCLYVDSRDRLWIGTNDSGVFVMVRGELRQWDKAEGLKSSSVRAIAEDPDGTVYVGSTVGIAVIDGEMNLKGLHDERIASVTVKDLRRGADGRTWGLTTNGDLFTLRGGRVSSFLGREEIPIEEGVISILPDPEEADSLYIGTDSDRIYHGTAGDGFAAAEVLRTAPLSDTENMEYIGGRIWICGGDGIGSLDAAGFHPLTNVPMNSSVGRVMTDYEGNLWFTSTRQGVMKIVPNQFSDYFALCGLESEVVNSTCRIGERVFIATDAGLIVTENGKKLESLPLTRVTTAGGKEIEETDLIAWLKGVRIRSVIRDSRGRV